MAKTCNPKKMNSNPTGTPFRPGDKVTFRIGRRQVRGTIAAIDTRLGTAHIHYGPDAPFVEFLSNLTPAPKESLSPGDHHKTTQS